MATIQMMVVILKSIVVKIGKIMSGESVRIKYVSKFHFKDVQRLLPR